jgi:single-strand DNA-binding protein
MIAQNRVVLTGKVANPPQRHYRPDGAPVVQFSLELNGEKETARPALNRSGKNQRGPNRINIVAIGKLAEFETDYLQIGQSLTVEGRLNQRCWQTPEGRNRTCTEIIATDLRKSEVKDQIMDLSTRGEENEETC